MNITTLSQLIPLNGLKTTPIAESLQHPAHDYSPITETARFYKALSTVGTDFSIMQQLFPQRSRLDLKKKFKKEERKNPHLVERAMTDTMQYDLTIFDGDGEARVVHSGVNCYLLMRS